MKCQYCESDELVHDKSVNDYYCQTCGRWQTEKGTIEIEVYKEDMKTYDLDPEDFEDFTDYLRKALSDYIHESDLLKELAWEYQGTKVELFPGGWKVKEQILKSLILKRSG